DGTPIMIFVGSGGCIQIHSGPIKGLLDTNRRVNDPDPSYNLPPHDTRGSCPYPRGPIKRQRETNGWFNVLDPIFNLHLREAGVARVFSVRKPTDDGMVTSIEAFDSRDRTILLMFGTRKPGQAELETWRALVAQVEK